MIYITAILLGIIQGITEFLPISSTGHVLLAQKILGFPSPIYSSVIQLGSAIALLIAYKPTWLPLLRSPKQHLLFIIRFCIALIPASVLGLLFRHQLHLLTPYIGYALIFGGLFFLWLDYIRPAITTTHMADITYRQSLKIGLAQAIALIPGISRSGATIGIANLIGISLVSAVEFSFLLAIPTSLGAGVVDLLTHSFSSQEYALIALGSIAAFISATWVLQPCLMWIKKYGLLPFGYYRIIIGALLLWI